MYTSCAESDTHGCSSRRGLLYALLNETVDDSADFGSGRAECPTMLGRDIFEDTHKEDGEHRVHLLLSEYPVRVVLRLQWDATLEENSVIKRKEQRR